MNNTIKKHNDTAVIIILSIAAAMLTLVIIIAIACNFLNSNTTEVSDVNAVLTSDGLSLGELKVDNRATGDAKSAARSLSGRQVYYAGLEDCVVNQDTVVYLENLAENIDIYMAYEITVDGEIVFKTDLIPPGEYVEWTPAENLDAGKTYVVYLKETPYYEENEGQFLPLTAPTNMVNITVTK